MKKLSIAFVAVLSLAAAGCKKGGADCDKAIAHSMELSKADMVKMGVDDKMMEKMKDIGLQHCKDDKWSEDAVKCMSEAKAEVDAQACYGKLTSEQQEKMNKAAMELKPSAGGSAAGSSAGPGGSASPTPGSTGSAGK